MKFKETSLANASAITIGVFFIVCRLLVSLFPGLMFSIAQSWLHDIELTKLDTTNSTTATFLLGLISSIVLAWVTGYIFAKIYNLMKS